MRVLVCGGRRFHNRILMEKALKPFLELNPVEVVIHGGAEGADKMAGRIAQSLRIPVMIFPANWEHLGKKAGMVRNRDMLVLGKPNVIFAFPTPSSIGTRGMIKMAREEFCIKVEVYE